MPDLERVLAERERDLLDQPLARDHALRAAEAAKRGVRDGVGLERQRAQVRVVEVIAVVGVEQRPVGDRPGQVGRVAAARGVGDVDALDAAVVVEADGVVGDEIVALAGDHHVVVAVGADLGRAPGLLGDERGDAGEQVALGLLAAEAAAHAPALDRDGVVGHAQHDRHHVLDLARVLGRGVDRDLVVLARDRQRDLALEVEMVLAADRDLALDAGAAPQRSPRPHRRALSVSGSVTSFSPGRAAATSSSAGSSSYSTTASRAARRAWSRVSAATANSGWPAYSTTVGREQRLVVPMGRADVVDARHIVRGQHQRYPRRASHRLEIEAA